jgi:Lon protease-like protein
MKEVCLFPLPNSLTLKNISIPYHIFEHRYKTMINDAVEKGLDIAVLLIDNSENYQDRVCVAGFPTILNVYDNGRMDIVITGKIKCKLKKCKQTEPYLIYTYEELQEDTQLDDDQKEDLSLIKDLVLGYVKSQEVLKNQLKVIESLLNDPTTIISYANLLLVQQPAQKEKIMQLDSLKSQVELLLEVLSPDKIDMGKFITPIKIK